MAKFWLMQMGLRDSWIAQKTTELEYEWYEKALNFERIIAEIATKKTARSKSICK